MSVAAEKRVGAMDAENAVEGQPPWLAYLLVSPTRSSIVGFARPESMDRQIAWHNGELGTHESGPEATALLRPWRAALTVRLLGRCCAAQAARSVARASGFRTRLEALRRVEATPQEERAASTASAGEEAGDSEDLDLDAGLDTLTYASVEFVNPNDNSRRVVARALVDTGSSDCELHGELVGRLGLRARQSKGKGEDRIYETAAGRTFKAKVFWARVRVMGREAKVSLTMTGEEGRSPVKHASLSGSGQSETGHEDVDVAFGFGADTDEAILGFKALRSLGLLVDCGRRSLRFPLPMSSIRTTLPIRGGRVTISLSNPNDPRRFREVRALVDSGSTDVDVASEVIEALGLVSDSSEGVAQFETAGGVTIEAPIFRALLAVLGEEASVRVSPSEAGKSCDSSSSTDDDEALLGHDALAALNLLVDCRCRLLLVPRGVGRA